MTRRRALVLVLAAAFTVAFTWVFWPPSEGAFYDYLAERRAAGLPNTRDEVRGPMPDDSENGATGLLSGWAELVQKFGPQTTWKASAFDTTLAIGGTWPEGLTDAQSADLARTAERLRPALDPLVAALDKPHLLFPVTFNPSGARDRAEIELYRSVIQALAIPAAGEADSGRRTAALCALLRLGERIHDKTLLDFMFAYHAQTIALRSLRRGISAGEVDAARARAACDPLLRTPHVDGFRRATRGDVVELIEEYRDLVEGHAIPSTATLMLWQRIDHGIERAQRRLSGRSGPLDFEFEPGHADTIVALCRLREATAAAPDLRTLLTSGGRAAIDPSGLTRKGAIVDAYTGFIPHALSYDAAASLARVALAAAEFRATHGDFPASLDELRPMFADGIPLDPFTDAPFVYARTSAGVRIASAGRLPADTPPDDGTLREKCLLWELKR